MKIKKIVGNKEKEITLEDLYNKLCGIHAAYSHIFKANYSSLTQAEIIGLNTLFWETLEELELLLYGKMDHRNFKHSGLLRCLLFRSST